MKTILVATDFSPASLNAANYAADMASAINADILLLHVYHTPVTYSEIPAVITPDDLMEDAEKNINGVKKQLSLKTNSKINIATEVRMGLFFEELKIVCERTNPYTVVMGSQGTTATERLFFGSHTVHAMKQLQWPLLTIPPQVKFSSIKKIGLACDFTKVADTIPVDEIKTLINDFHAELHVLNIGKKEAFKPELVFESGLLQEMLVAVKPEYHFITGNNTDEGIMDFAESNHIDLLIVLPKRHGLLEKLILKSHSKQLVLHSHVPVMALH
ncbi:MAG: universal stress protein [Chitinophagaceae bacterium]